MSRAAALARVRHLAARAAAWLRQPLAWVLVASLVLRLTGLTWGLPASDGWDDDGVAPRDFLSGVAMTYWPGHHYIYPPLQLLILTVVSAPVWIATLLRAPSFDQDAIIQTFIQVPTMTWLTVVARATTIVLALGILWNIAKLTEDLRGSRRAGVWAAAACGVNVVFTYYSQTTNLDVPYLFWAVLALRGLVRAIVHEDARALRRVPIVAALAVATKDQAYALFLLGVPLACAAWLFVDAGARRNVRAIVRELAIGAALALMLLLVVDGAVFNPGGFKDRMGLLLGAASQDHAYYPKGWAGRYHAFFDTFGVFREYYPWVFAPFVALGLFVAVRTPDRARRAAGLAPALFALSFTLAFNVTARRTEHRFVLPQMLMWGIYAGIAFDAAQSLTGRSKTFWVVAGACFAMALFRAAAVDVAMLSDPRYDAEAWMRAHVRSGDRVEVYGNNVHLPRFPAWAVVERVDTTPLGGRNPLPGVIEVSDRFSDIESRRPKFVVVSEFWAARYLWNRANLERAGKRELTPMEVDELKDLDSRAFFRDLRDGHLAYRWAHLSEWTSLLWPRVDIHESLTRDVWIFERI